jgi:hypothetical protein
VIDSPWSTSASRAAVPAQRDEARIVITRAAEEAPNCANYLTLARHGACFVTG